VDGPGGRTASWIAQVTSMTHQDEIEQYHSSFSAEDAQVCRTLRTQIDGVLAEAESKIWHAHPVWFLDGNPIVGYARLKDGIRLLFWSGQSFEEPDLKPEGKFKAAEARYSSVAEIDVVALSRWLGKARDIQWDYKNIVKRKGVLNRLK
jgi:hypothetical protein